MGSHGPGGKNRWRYSITKEPLKAWYMSTARRKKTQTIDTEPINKTYGQKTSPTKNSQEKTMKTIHRHRNRPPDSMSSGVIGTRERGLFVR